MISSLRVIVAWVTLFLVGTDLFIVSPLIPMISHSLAVPGATSGLIVTSFAAGYVLAAPVFGHIADRRGRNFVLLICLFFFALTNFLTAGVGSFSAMIAVRFAAGVVASGIAPSIYVLVGQTAPTGRRGTWIAIVITGLLSSLPLGASAGTMLARIHGWPPVFMSIGLMCACLIPVHYLIWPQAERNLGEALGHVRRLNAVALYRSLVPTVAWSTSLYGMYTYLGSGLPSLGYSSSGVAEVILVYGAGGLIGAITGGRLADRFGPSFVIRLSVCGMAASFLLLDLAFRLHTGIYPAFLAIAIFAQIFFPAQQSFLLQSFAHRGATAISFNNSALFLGIGLGSAIGGQVMKLGDFTNILPASAGLAIVAWASFLMVSATRFRSLGEANVSAT